MSEDNPEGKIEKQLTFIEDVVFSYKSALGLWYWKFPKIRHGLIFYPIVTILTLYGVARQPDLTEIGQTIAKGSLGVVVLATGTIFSQIAHTIWPKPTEKLDEPETIGSRLLMRNLTSLFIISLLLSLVVHNVLGLIGWLSFVNNILPVIILEHWLRDFIHGLMASFGALLLLSSTELWRKRRSGLSNPVPYFAILLLFCASFTTLITVLWL